MSPRYNAEADLAVQFMARGIGFETEFRFCSERRWRADFRAWRIPFQSRERSVLVEIDGGGGAGRHGTSGGMRADAEKQSAAAALGWRVIRLDPSHVKSGKGLSWIEAALGLRSDVADLFRLPERNGRAPKAKRSKASKLSERVRLAAERAKR